MSPKSTVYKVELQVSDLDRHYYQTHALTLALHPSETEERMMVRLIAFALNADEALAFGRGLSDDEEPDLWQRDLTGAIDLWIEVGQPDEARIKRAAGRSRQVKLYTYSGRGAQIWWEKTGSAIERKNVEVVDLPAEECAALTALVGRSMRLHCMIEDGQMQWMDGSVTVQVNPVPREARRR
jgi:uncharacterized protein YaeQ